MTGALWKNVLAIMRSLVGVSKMEIICSVFSSTQGILLVYDITNRWSFDGIDRWIKEIDEVRTAKTRLDHLEPFSR